MQGTGMIFKSTVGEDLLVQWTICNFFFLPQENNAHYTSPDFSFNGVTWNLGIYPHDTRSFGCLSLYLKKQSSEYPITQTFSFSLKNVRGEKYNEKSCTKNFGLICEIHEFPSFLSKSELSVRQGELLPKGILSVVCIMKRTTSDKIIKHKVSNAKINNTCLNPYLARFAKSVASGSNNAITIYTKGNAKSEASGSNQTGAIKSKESVMKWIKENCTEASKGTKRKIEEENVLKWIDENCKETSGATKRRMEEKNSEASPSESTISPQQRKVLHDLKELFRKKEDCDVIIKVKGSEFKAHKVILKARSPVFASTLQQDTKENATSVVEIEDCEPSYFSDFLHFIYCGDLGMISKENVFALYTASGKYEVHDLKEKCLEFLKKNISVDTFCETITFALQHSETELVELASNFFVKNAKEILSTVKWQAFVVKNPGKSNELFMQFVNSVEPGNS